MFATYADALALAGQLLRPQAKGGRPFVLDGSGFWQAPALPEGAESKALLNRIKPLRGQVAGFLSAAEAGDTAVLTEGLDRMLVFALQVEGQPGLQALSLFLAPSGLAGLDSSAQALLNQTEGLSFLTDGVEARSGGKLGPVASSYWQPEGWHELWSRLLIMTHDADVLPAQATDTVKHDRAYSLTLCRFVELSFQKTRNGLAGRLVDTGTGSEVLFSFFTYAGNPTVQLPADIAMSKAGSLQSTLSTGGRRAWALYLAHAGQPGQSAHFQTEYAAGADLNFVEIRTQLVFGPRGTLAGHHHEVFLVDDPALKNLAPTTPASNGQSQHSVAEAELLIREADHRIKNSISIAASLMQLQSFTIQDEQAKAILMESVQRLYTVSELHEALYKYTSGGLEQVSMKPFLEMVADRLRPLISTQGIELRTQIEDHILPGKTASRIGLLVNELVLNAAKYAFVDRKEGIVAIYFTKSDNSFYLSVQDNGRGFEDRAGADASSLGTTLISEFAKELKADMRLETQAGTRYVFTFQA